MVGAVAIAAIVAAGALGVSPAGSQEVAGVRFTWEINFTTLIVMVGAAFGWWFTVVRQGDKVKTHAATIAQLKIELAKKIETEALEKLQSELESLNIVAAKIQHEHTSLKDEVYREYMNANAIRDIRREIREDVAGTEGRLMEAINALSGRLDNFSHEKHR